MPKIIKNIIISHYCLKINVIIFFDYFLTFSNLTYQFTITFFVHYCLVIFNVFTAIYRTFHFEYIPFIIFHLFRVIILFLFGRISRLGVCKIYLGAIHGTFLVRFYGFVVIYSVNLLLFSLIRIFRPSFIILTFRSNIRILRLVSCRNYP